MCVCWLTLGISKCSVSCRHHDLVDRYEISVTNDHRYVPLVVSTSQSFPRSWLVTGFVTRGSEFTPGFSGVRVTRTLVLYVCFVDRYLSFCTFSFGHCVVCSSSIYGFLLPLWYLQTLLNSSESWISNDHSWLSSLSPVVHQLGGNNRSAPIVHLPYSEVFSYEIVIQ